MSQGHPVFSLQGKTGIITGGAGILGTRFAPAFLASGANVVIADVEIERARKHANDLSEEHGPNRVITVQCDVTQRDSVNAMVEETVRTFGDIHWLLNNAGSAAEDPKEYFASFEDYDLAEWHRVMAINLDGMFLVAQAVGKRMVAQGVGGSIIQTSSIYGVLASDNRIYEGSTFKDYAINCPAVYSASKAGVLGLTRWLASYWADKNIRVNSVAPGGVFSHENDVFTAKYSARIPLGRMARDDEITGTMLYLASDASSYVTGQCLMVDGGLSAW